VNTVKDLLELALDDGPNAEQHVNPAGDVANGRRLLRRRRLAAGVVWPSPLPSAPWSP
jgi:hypothetical protein